MIAFTNQSEAQACRTRMRIALMDRYLGSTSATSKHFYHVYVHKPKHLCAYVDFGMQDATVTVFVNVCTKAGVLYQKDIKNPRISDNSWFEWVIHGEEEVAEATRQMNVLLTYHFCFEREQALALKSGVE